MKEIERIEVITSIYKTWKPSDIAFIKALNWSANNLEIVFYSQLRDRVKMWPDFLQDFFELTISFKNISSLKIDFDGSGLHQISGFDIVDVSNNGWEKVNFRIEDYENNSISFTCEKIEIVRLSDRKKIMKNSPVG